jgi:hypothetical protein
VTPWAQQSVSLMVTLLGTPWDRRWATLLGPPSEKQLATSSEKQLATPRVLLLVLQLVLPKGSLLVMQKATQSVQR